MADPIINCPQHMRLGLLVDILSQEDDAGSYPGGRMKFGIDRGVTLNLIRGTVIDNMAVQFELTHAGDIALSLVVSALNSNWRSEHLSAYLDAVQLD